MNPKEKTLVLAAEAQALRLATQRTMEDARRIVDKARNQLYAIRLMREARAMLDRRGKSAKSGTGA